KTTGTPKINGSLIPLITGIAEILPSVFKCFALLNNISISNPNAPPEPPIIAIRNICKFIGFVASKPAATSSLFSPVFVIPIVKTIGKIMDGPLIPINQSKFPKVQLQYIPKDYLQYSSLE